MGTACGGQGLAAAGDSRPGPYDPRIIPLPDALAAVQSVQQHGLREQRAVAIQEFVDRFVGRIIGDLIEHLGAKPRDDLALEEAAAADQLVEKLDAIVAGELGHAVMRAVVEDFHLSAPLRLTHIPQALLPLRSKRGARRFSSCCAVTLAIDSAPRAPRGMLKFVTFVRGFPCGSKSTYTPIFPSSKASRAGRSSKPSRRGSSTSMPRAWLT